MKTALSLIVVAGLLAAARFQTPQAGPPAVDSAAVNQGLDALRDRYIALQTGGDATGLAGLFTETAGIDLFGLPRMRNRAAIEAAFTQDMAARKYTLAEIHPVSRFILSNTTANELGTYHDMHDAKGKKDHEWGRYVGSFVLGSGGTWQIVYLMAFPDSIKPAK